MNYIVEVSRWWLNNWDGDSIHRAGMCFVGWLYFLTLLIIASLLRELIRFAHAFIETVREETEWD